MDFLSYSVELWERGFLDLFVVELPHVLHVDQAVRADRAEKVSGSHQLIKARFVDQMIAWRDLQFIDVN